MKNYTFSQLEEMMFEKGNNLADVAIGRMMTMIEEETGQFPSWNDNAPAWVVKNCIG